MPSIPHFFIVGAAKCGTTALFEYLSGHPDVFMPPIKEPKYFCPDLKSIGSVRTYEEYMDLFAAAPTGAVTGEASTWYVYSKIAIELIMKHNPEAKIIMMLRHPVDAAYSLYMAAWEHGHENLARFEDAWQAQEARLSGLNMPPNWPEPLTLQYGSLYRYAPQVRRLIDLVPARQRLFLVYEEFFVDPQRHFQRTLEFLNLPPHGRAKFPVINPSIGPRSARVQSMLRNPPNWLRVLYAPIRPLMRAARLNPHRFVWRMNSVAKQKAVLPTQLRAELDSYFEDDIVELEELLGRQLWRALPGR